MPKFELVRPDNDKDWLELRTKVLTASEVAIILGLNPYQSVAEMEHNKKNPQDLENNAFVWMGRELEPVVVSVVNKAFGSDFELYDIEGTRAFFLDVEFGLGATPDAVSPTTGALLECKSTKPHNYMQWGFWPPSYYLVQLYTQLVCTDKSTGYLGVMSTNLTHKTSELNLPVTVHRLERCEKFDKALEFEVNRYWETVGEGKKYRVNRKQAVILEAILRSCLKHVHGR